MNDSRGQVKLAATLITKHDEGSYFDKFKKKKYYFKLYFNRLEVFTSAESSLKAPRFTLYPGEDTCVKKCKSPPYSIKVHSKDVKITIETKSREMQSQWLEVLMEVFQDKVTATQVAKENKVQTSGEASVSDLNVNISKEIAKKFNMKSLKSGNSNDSSSMDKSNFVRTPKISSALENTKLQNVRQLKFPRGNAKMNSVPSPLPLKLKTPQANECRNILNNSNVKGPPAKSICSSSPPMSSLPPIKPLVQRPKIVPSEELYDEPEDYDSLEEQDVQIPAVQEKNSLEIIPLNLAKVLYGCHGSPQILKFKDGKISLLNKFGAVIVNWEFRHVRKFKSKADLFCFETGHKHPGGTKFFEFQLVEKVNQKSKDEITQMILQEMKLVNEDGSKKIKNSNSVENIPGPTSERIISISTSPSDIRRSNFIQNDVMQTPVVPPPFTSKPKSEAKRSIVIIPSNDQYDEYVGYDGLEDEDEPTEQLTQPLLPTTQPLDDGTMNKTRNRSESFWFYTTPSQRKNHEELESSSIQNNIPEEGTTSALENPTELQRYKGPIDDSLYALPSQS